MDCLSLRRKGKLSSPPFTAQENVLLCPPKDPKALAAAIDSLISRPELRQRLRTGALELAHEWLSWDKAVKRTIAAFKGSE
jgi:glycosyltransferase involved in cell wall biosynthesis